MKLQQLYKEANDKVFKDIMELSSGTIASISGYRKYSDIEDIRNAFIQWADGKKFDSWQQAWKQFEKEYDVKNKKMKS